MITRVIDNGKYIDFADAVKVIYSLHKIDGVDVAVGGKNDAFVYVFGKAENVATGKDIAVNFKLTPALITVPAAVGTAELLRAAIVAMSNTNLNEVGPVLPLILRFCDTVGNGTGVKNANTNSLIVAETFKIEPPAGQIFRIETLEVYIEDSGMLDSGRYGDGLTLVNGVKIQSIINAVTTDLLDGQPIFTNGQFLRGGFITEINQFGAGNGMQIARLEFKILGGQPLRLVGDDGDGLEIVLQDNLTGLIGHFFKVLGYREQ